MKPLKALGAVGAASAALLTGCAAPGTASDQPASEPMAGMANPASVWCVKHYHGMLEMIRMAANTRSAICRTAARLRSGNSSVLITPKNRGSAFRPSSNT